MSKNALLLTFLMIFSPISLAQSEADDSKGKGPMAKMQKFCKVSLPIIQSIASLAFPELYPTIQATPLGPMPGLMIGLAQRSSVLQKICDIALQLDQLEGLDAAFFVKNTLNTMTDNLWQDHLGMVDSTWNLAAQIYDFENGKSVSAAFQSMGTYRAMDDFMDESYSWYNKTVNGKDARRKNRGERERDMQELARAVQRKAVLAEALDCPGGKKDSKDYNKIYKREVGSQFEVRAEAKDDYTYYKNQLLKMGPKMMNSQGEMQEFIDDIEMLESGGVGYKQGRGETVSEETWKPTKKIDRKTKKIKYKKHKIKRKTQTWQAKLYVDVFNSFRKKWGSQWRSYVIAQVARGGIRGIFDNPRGRVEAQFIDLYYECSTNKLMRGVDRDRPDYYKEREKRVASCKKTLKTNTKKSEGLLNYYADKLQTSLFKYKTANAKIWTAESLHLGKNRIPSEDGSDLIKEKVVCESSRDITPAQMDMLKVKQKEALNEFKNIIAKNQMKKTTMAEEKAKAEAKQTDELRKRQSFAERQSEQLRQDMGGGLAPVAPSGGM